MTNLTTQARLLQPGDRLSGEIVVSIANDLTWPDYLYITSRTDAGSERTIRSRRDVPIAIERA
jgi:hypothetical protein